MKNLMPLSAALVAALAAGSAEAQTRRTTPARTTSPGTTAPRQQTPAAVQPGAVFPGVNGVPVNGGVVLPNGAVVQQPFVNGAPNGALFQFVPGTGFVPLNAGGALPGTGFNGFNGGPQVVGVDPFGNPVTAFGTGFYPGFNPGLTSLPMYGISPYGTSQVPLYRGTLGVPSGAMPNGRVPVAGVNARRGRDRWSSRDTRVPVPAQGSDAALQVRAPSTDPQQMRVANRLENIMENRPMLSGRLIRTDAQGALVEYEVNGEIREDRFPLDQVFFFHQNGDASTLAVEPRLVAVGGNVLVPQPEAASPVQSVAGSRQVGGTAARARTTTSRAAASRTKRATSKSRASKARAARRRR